MRYVLLTRLGVERLWGGGPEGAWLFMRYFVTPALLQLARPSGYGSRRIPVAGGAVLAANHLSDVDPPLIGIFSPRAVWFMMKAELLASWAAQPYTWTGAFPIRRGESDRDGLRRARSLVEDGHVVGIFPEGSRQRLGHPGPFNPGAAMLALQEGVPLVPCAVETFGWTRRNRRRCCVVFGEPLDLDGLPRNGRGYRAATELLRREVTRLWRLAAQASTAGFPTALPDGTPRSQPVRPGQAIATPGRIRNVSALRA